MGVPSTIPGLERDAPQNPDKDGSERTEMPPSNSIPTPLPQDQRLQEPLLSREQLASTPSPLHGMQFGAPPLKIIHLKSVLSLTSSAVQDVVRRPLLQHSSLLRSVL